MILMVDWEKLTWTRNRKTLLSQVAVESLVVVDISPLNPPPVDPTDKSSWNMEHFFHCMKAVKFDQSLSMSKVRVCFVVLKIRRCCGSGFASIRNQDPVPRPDPHQIEMLDPEQDPE